MGRIYITLGAPQQKARYVAQSGVRGMEIWFYENRHPALPPFFNIVFYEKDFGDFVLGLEWRIKATPGLYPMPDVLPDGSYRRSRLPPVTMRLRCGLGTIRAGKR